MSKKSNLSQTALELVEAFRQGSKEAAERYEQWQEEQNIEPETK